MSEKKRAETKSKIKECFAELILEKGFESLTVSDIARRASLNRGTFYLHYLDKYDLLQQLEDELLAGFKENFEGKGVNSQPTGLCLMSRQIIINSLNYALDNFLIIRALISEKGDWRFIEKFKIMLREHLKKKDSYLPTINLMYRDIPMDYAEEILLSRTISILMLWIRKEGKDSPEEIADLIIRAATAPPMAFLG